MGRPPRIWFPGAMYHLILRGDNREAVFFGRKDYLRYLTLLKQAKERFQYRLLAYALMTNHIHLMMETGDTAPIWKIMQSINEAYTLDLNVRYKRVGHIFQGRYRSILVEKDSYCLELTRYIHLNPVRARLVASPEDYEWSSYRHYLGLGRPGLVDCELVLGMMSQRVEARIQRYRTFVEDGMASQRDLEQEVVSGQFLGTNAFVTAIQNQLIGARHQAQKFQNSVLGA